MMSIDVANLILVSLTSLGALGFSALCQIDLYLTLLVQNAFPGVFF